MDPTPSCPDGSCGTCGSGGDVEPTPRWWIIVWTSWGIALASMILTLDRDPISGLLFGIAGLSIGFFGMQVLRPLDRPFFEWYHSFNGNADRRRLVFKCITEERTDSSEFRQLVEELQFDGVLALPVLFGLFHGVLIGGICGALCPLDSFLKLSASTGALIGMVIGPVFFSIIAAMALAWVAAGSKELPVNRKRVRRFLIIIAPALSVPVAWHCLKTFAKTRSANHRTNRSP